MDIEEIKLVVDGIPHMDYKQAKKITSFIQSKKLTNILELGFRHGVSSCYIAGSLEEIGGGHLTTIDKIEAINAHPNIDELLKELELSSFVSVYYEPVSYIWRLMKMIEENTTPKFDFCYIDGAHDWYTDGFAFFLVDKLLKPEGWIIFDDLFWTFNSSQSWKNSERVKQMPTDERETAQVGKIFELLVKDHPQYHNFNIIDDWGYAQKKEEDYIQMQNENIQLQTVVSDLSDRGLIDYLTGKLPESYKKYVAK